MLRLYIDGDNPYGHRVQSMSGIIKSKIYCNFIFNVFLDIILLSIITSIIFYFCQFINRSECRGICERFALPMKTTQQYLMRLVVVPPTS